MLCPKLVGRQAEVELLLGRIADLADRRGGVELHAVALVADRPGMKVGVLPPHRRLKDPMQRRRDAA